MSLLTAYILGSLNDLEELILPTGDGICQVAKLIIQQCQHLQFLRVLTFFQTLNDDSIMEIGELPSNKMFLSACMKASGITQVFHCRSL